MDELIRESLKRAAEETEISPEKKVDMLINVLTRFLSEQIEDDKKEG